MKRSEQVIAEVFGLYEQFGDADYIGEPVSQIEHMSQASVAGTGTGRRLSLIGEVSYEAFRSVISSIRV